MTIEDFIKKFVYKRDKPLDSYRFLTAENGFAGDCDDFAYTVARLLYPSTASFTAALVRGTISFVTVRTKRGEGHLVLHYKELGYIDNIYPYWRKELKFDKKPLSFTSYPLVFATLPMKVLFGKL